MVSVIRKSPILFLIQRYGQLGWYKSKILLHTGTTDKDAIIQAGPGSNMFLGFAAKGRFGTCAHYFAAGTVFRPFPPPFGNSY